MPVAAALRAAGRWDLDHPRDFDADDWWYRCRFTLARFERAAAASLRGPGHRGRRLAQRHAHPALGEHVRRARRLTSRRSLARTTTSSSCASTRSRRCSPLPRRRGRGGAPVWSRTRRCAGTAHRCSGACRPGARRWRRSGRGGRSCSSRRPLALEQCRRARRARRRRRRRRRVVSSVTVSVRRSPRGNADGRRRGRVPIVRTRCSERRRFALIATSACRGPSAGGRTRMAPQPLYPVRAVDRLGGECRQRSISAAWAFAPLSVDRGADGDGFGLASTASPVFCRGVCWTPLDLARLAAEPATIAPRSSSCATPA